MSTLDQILCIIGVFEKETEARNILALKSALRRLAWETSDEEIRTSTLGYCLTESTELKAILKKCLEDLAVRDVISG